MRFLVLGLHLILVCVAQAYTADNRDKLKDITHRAKPGTVVVFDIDDTLSNVAYRHHQIFMDFVKEPSTLKKFPALAQHIRNNLELRHIKYFSKDSLQNIGITSPEGDQFLADFDPYWTARFFTSEWVQKDRPYVGAVAYVNALYKKGTTIVYITGRNEPNMGEGTRKELRTEGFPLESQPRVHLFMKPDPKTPDIDFKKQVFEKVRSLGSVIACFENEPINILAMKEAFPSSTAFFVDTRNGSDRKNLVGKSDIYWIRDFVLQE